MERDKLLSFIREDRLDKFYRSTEWRKLRKVAVARDNHECCKCKERGYVGPADCVHHILEVKLYPDKALDLNNLQTLCNKCHNITHDKLLIHNKKQKPKRFINEERW